MNKVVKLPSTVTRHHTRMPSPESPSDRQFKCAGCKHVIKFFDQYAQVCTEFGRHYWHLHCYDRKRRRHLTLQEFDAWCRANT